MAGTDTDTVKNKLIFTVLQYNKFGALVDMKPMDTDLLPCLATFEDAVYFQSFGLNLVKNCLFSDLQSNTDTYFDVYVTSADLKLV